MGEKADRVGCGKIAVSVCVAWLRFGRELVPWNVVIQIPRYVFAKLGIYGRFVGKRQTEWVRTRREGEE